MTTLPQSVTDTVESRTLLSVLARLGSMTEQEPSLLLLRSTALSLLGRFDVAGDDLDRAMELVVHADPPLQRRVLVQHAHRLVADGRFDEARQAAQEALRDLGAGEERTYARAQSVLAEAAGMSDRRDDLQRAAEYYSVAIRAWEVCGEYAKARVCRCDLATSALVPLGRYDEALAEMNVVLGASDVTEAEHAWMLLTHGFVLVNANRIPLAESRFERVAELGHVQANPRLAAAAAWGRALVAMRRDDLEATLRWVATAENTALGEADDLLGLPFLCDVATGLGALGELDLADVYLARARERTTVYPDQLRLAAFVLEARRGVVGDVAAQLAVTPPAECWRVNLVCALAAANAGDLATARRLRDEAERDIRTFGFADLRSLGELRAVDAPGRAAERRRQAPRTGTGTGPGPSAGGRGHAASDGGRADEDVARHRHRHGHHRRRRDERSARWQPATPRSASSRRTAARPRSTSSPTRSGPTRTARRAGPGCATCCCGSGGGSATW